jgi:hypothetical protein
MDMPQRQFDRRAMGGEGHPLGTKQRRALRNAHETGHGSIGRRCGHGLGRRRDGDIVVEPVDRKQKRCGQVGILTEIEETRLRQRQDFRDDGLVLRAKQAVEAMDRASRHQLQRPRLIDGNRTWHLADRDGLFAHLLAAAGEVREPVELCVVRGLRNEGAAALATDDQVVVLEQFKRFAKRALADADLTR